MVDAQKIQKKTALQTQPVQPIIDMSFWQHFTKQKLDHWRLQTPEIEIFGQIALPNSVNNPSDLYLSAQSFPDVPRKKVTGGLLQFLVPGVFVHTNTIEEYEELDLEAILAKQHEHISGEVRELPNGLKVNMANRFVLAIFGDLKNYVYHYKFCTLEMASDHVNQVKANKVAKVFDQA